MISAHEQIGNELDHASFSLIILTCFSADPIPRFHIRLPTVGSTAEAPSRSSPSMDGDQRRPAATVVTFARAVRAQDSPARRLIAWLQLLFRECQPPFLSPIPIRRGKIRRARFDHDPIRRRFGFCMCRGVRSEVWQARELGRGGGGAPRARRPRGVPPPEDPAPPVPVMEGVVAAAAASRRRHRPGGRQGHGSPPRALAPEADQSSHAHPGSIPSSTV